MLKMTYWDFQNYMTIVEFSVWSGPNQRSFAFFRGSGTMFNPKLSTHPYFSCWRLCSSFSSSKRIVLLHFSLPCSFQQVYPQHFLLQKYLHMQFHLPLAYDDLSLILRLSLPKDSSLIFFSSVIISSGLSSAFSSSKNLRMQTHLGHFFIIFFLEFHRNSFPVRV